MSDKSRCKSDRCRSVYWSGYITFVPSSWDVTRISFLLFFFLTLILFMNDGFFVTKTESLINLQVDFQKGDTK